MTRTEWAALAAILAGGWAGPFSTDAELAYFALLSDYDRAEVEAALKALARRGGSFRPSVAEIAGSITEQSAPPSFDEAWPVVVRMLVKHHGNGVIEALRELQAITLPGGSRRMAPLACRKSRSTIRPTAAR